MRTLLISLLVVLPLALSSAVAAKELKIGVVDIARVMEESPQADAARTTIQNEFEPRQQELIKKQKGLRDLEERIARDGAVMSNFERDKLERKLISGKREFKRDQDEFRDDLNFKQNELLQGLQRKLIGSIRQYAKSSGYDLLLAEGVVYTDDALNITAEILEQLKKDKK